MLNTKTDTEIKNRIAKERIWELDFVRGLCVALMIMDHFFYDLGFVFLSQWFPHAQDGNILYEICSFARDFYWDHPLRHIVRTIVLVGFIGGCGISCSLSHSNLKRGLKLLAVAGGLSIVTWSLDKITGSSGFFISFGVLHMLSVSILAYALLSRFGFMPNLLIGAAIVLAGCFFGPETTDNGGFALYALGLNNALNSADYFPLIPYLGWFLVGAAVGSKIYKEKRSFFPHKGKSRVNRPVLWLGGHALLIYVIHQPFIYGLLVLLTIIFT